MKSKRNLVALVAVAWTLSVCSTAQAAAGDVWTVDTTKGDILLNGKMFKVQGGSWFGLEGRQESPANGGGAPMEMYMGNVFWTTPSSGRTLAQDAKEIKALGFNSIRMPVVPQTLNNTDPMGLEPNLKNATTVRNTTGAFNALKEVIAACKAEGLYVLLDMHSCSNYVGWRKGRLDARPPWTDAKRTPYDYAREDCSCADDMNPSTVTKKHPYNETKWLADLKTLAGMGDNIMGIDIYNEPWDYSWPEWRDMIDKAYTAISSVNPNILIYAQGVGGTNGNQDGTPNTVTETPHGKYNVNWGENLFEAGGDPPKVCPKSKLVYSPHTYGPSVCPQWMFADPAQTECDTLVEDAFGDAKCQIVINPEILEASWQEHFGYLRNMGYAIAVGEFGGNMDWPKKSDKRLQDRYKYLTNTKSDEQWQNAFADYLIKKGITNSFYWSINPESADTYGVFSTPYDPLTNTSAWGTWGTPDTRKTTLLKRIWDAPIVYPPLSVNPHKISTIAGGFNCKVSNAGKISYSLPKAEFVSLKVFNVSGRLQSEIISQKQDAGSYSVNQKVTVPSAGTYLVTFKAGDYSQSQMVYLK